MLIQLAPASTGTHLGWCRAGVIPSFPKSSWPSAGVFSHFLDLRVPSGARARIGTLRYIHIQRLSELWKWEFGPAQRLQQYILCIYKVYTLNMYKVLVQTHAHLFSLMLFNVSKSKQKIIMGREKPWKNYICLIVSTIHTFWTGKRKNKGDRERWIAFSFLQPCIISLISNEQRQKPEKLQINYVKLNPKNNQMFVHLKPVFETSLWYISQ